MPNKWKTYKIGDVCSRIYSGGTPSTKKKEFWNGEIPWLSSGETRERYVSSTDKTITNLGFENSSARMANKGSVVIASAGQGKTRGQTSFLNLDTTINQSVICVEPDRNLIDDKFLFFNLSNRYNEFRRISDAFSIRGSLTIDLIKTQIKINLPPLPEQKAIAQILSAIDDKIENNLAINKTLEDMAMALYKHWFVDFDFPITKESHPELVSGSQPIGYKTADGEFINSELGPIPKCWEVKSIGDFIEVVSGYAFKSKWFQDEGERVLKIKNISNNVVDINNCSFIPSDIALNIDDKFRVYEGDFLVAMTGAEVGKVGVVPNYNQTLWLNQRVGKLKDKAFKNSSVFIGKILQSIEYYDIIQGLAYGSAQPNISASGIEKIEICLPENIDDINFLIEEFVMSHEQIVHNLTENQTLTKLRDTLLPKLISGELRLKEFREQIEKIIINDE